MSKKKYKPNIFTVVLTGGVASGKSAAADFFAELGVPIIDTDVLARQVVEPGSQGLTEIVNLFGQQVLDKEQALNRRKLRKIIFNDIEKRKQLEAILHPLIEQAAIDQIKQLTNPQKEQKPPYIIVAVPLYAETKVFRWAHRVLVIDVLPDTQVERLTSRDSITDELAKKMLGAQASREQRLALADDVIANDATLESLRKACTKKHRSYCKAATRLHFWD